MTTLRIPTPADVHITRHAIEQLLIRFPEDLLPKDPEAYLHRLLRRAQPANPQRVPWRRAYAPGEHTLTLRVDRWNLILTPNRHSPPIWALVTVKRANGTETNVPRALREDRLYNHELVRTGQAANLLHKLIQDAGTLDPRILARLWYEHRYPLVLHGGYETFEAFYRTTMASPRPVPSTAGCAPLARRMYYDSAMQTETTS